MTLPPSLITSFKKAKKVSTDTRALPKGSIFFALSGENFNGNLYAEEALNKGAVAVVVDQKNIVPPLDKRYILVEDSLASLQALAHWYRKQFTIPIIGITGSNGKTTTKELMYAVLSSELKTYATIGNLNNHIGVPLTLLSMPEDIEVAIIEMGASKPGDITELCAIAAPTHGIITNVGKAHLEGMGGLRGVQKTKGELFAHLHQHDGTAWVNHRDKAVTEEATPVMRKVFFGKPEDDYHIKTWKVSFPGMKVEVSTPKTSLSLHAKLFGAHNVENILAAVVCGSEMSISEKSIREAVENYTPKMNRTQWIHLKGLDILLDAYNANPSSMASSIESLFHHAPDQTALILGDMKELGVFSKEAHASLGKLVSKYPKALFIGIGKEMKAAVDAATLVHKHSFLSLEEARPHLSELLKGQKLLFIKGSRGMALERILDFDELEFSSTKLSSKSGSTPKNQ